MGFKKPAFLDKIRLLVQKYKALGGYTFICDSPFFVFLRKHRCPDCQGKLRPRAVTKTMDVSSKEVKKYDVEVTDGRVSGNVTFTRVGFTCPLCQRSYSVADVKKRG